MKIAALTFVFSVVCVSAHAWTGVWNGGGGILVNGTPTTIGTSLDAQLKGQRLEAHEIPGLNLLTKTIRSLSLDCYSEFTILDSITPSDIRSYEKFDLSSSDPVYVSLQQLYSEQLHLPREQIVLLALTRFDISSAPVKNNRTLLLPDFFKLKKESEQAATLLHEALWLMAPTKKKTYDDVIQVEVLAQAYMENPQSSAAFYSFAKAFLFDFLDQPGLMVRATLMHDIAQGVFKKPLTVGDIFNQEDLDCSSIKKICNLKLRGNLLTKMEKNKSLFFRFIGSTEIELFECDKSFVDKIAFLSLRQELDVDAMTGTSKVVTIPLKDRPANEALTIMFP